MGNLTSQPQQQLSQSLKGEYQIESHPYLLHRSTNELCTLHKITTNSAPNSHRVTEVIQEYSHSKCESISKLKAHYLIDKRGYCSDEETYFLVFRGQNNYTLKDQVIKRRFYQRPFKEIEIQQIIETYLCGLREYNHRFQRDYDRLGLDSLVIDQTTKRIYLKDPWLSTLPDHEHSDKLIQLMQSYPSPQKLNAVHAPKVQSYNQFLSNLFSIGVISLQLKRLDFADTIYSKKKQLNYQDIRIRLSQINDQKLKRGISLLLDMEPNRRKQVFMIWGIENKEEHYLTPLNQQQTHTGYNRRTHKEGIANVQRQVVPKVNLNTPLQEVLPKHVESIVIHPSSNTLHTRSNTLSNIHFSHQEQPKANLNFNLGQGQGQPLISNHASVRQSQQIYQLQQQKKLETAKSFVSFKDYLSKEEVKPHHNGNPPQINIVHTTQPQFKQQRNYSPETRIISQPYTANINPITINTIPQASVPSKSINTTQTTPVFGAYKQSFTYYEQPNTKQHQRSISQSQQQQNKQIYQIIPEKNSNREVSKVEKNIQAKQDKEIEVKEINNAKNIIRASQSKQISPIKQQKDMSEDLKAEIKTETSPSKPNPNISETQTFHVRQEDQHDRTNTPKRPTSKNKFNSTIVEVRDEDTPDHSAKSQELIQEEYVVEEYETGSRYQGFKSGGMRNGRGRFYYQDGGYYEGQWKNNKMDGYGKLYYEGGKLAYEGQWSQDQFNGLGKVYNDNPIGFTGSFDYTNFDYLEDYWQYYEGMLSRDTKQGRGRIKLSNGEMFEGDFHEDKIQGFGKFHTLDGKTIEGIWRESKLIKIISNG